MKATRHHSINWVYIGRRQLWHFCGDVIEEYSNSKVGITFDIELQTQCMLGSNLEPEDCILINVILRTYFCASPSAAVRECERSTFKAVVAIEKKVYEHLWLVCEYRRQNLSIPCCYCSYLEPKDQLLLLSFGVTNACFICLKPLQTLVYIFFLFFVK